MKTIKQEFDFAHELHLENERVRLEPLGMHHAPLLCPIIETDKGLMKYTHIKVEDSSELKTYMEQALAEREAGTRYPLAIFDKHNGTYAGSTSFTVVSNKDGSLEIGYTWMGYDFQRTGLNRQMKLLMMQYAFETLGFSRVEYRADSRNQQSRKAIMEIGGVFEGELRSRVVKPDGYRASIVFIAFWWMNGPV